MRVYLRKPCLADAKEFVAKTRGSLDSHRPWVFPPTTPQGFAFYLDRLEDGRNAGFLVCEKESDEIAGLVNLNEIVRGALDSAYVGYWAVKRYQGLGYMGEGLAWVLDEAFGPMGLHRLEINIQPGNTRSISLARRLGLTKEGFSEKYLKVGGEWKDHERWAIIAENWQGVVG